MTRDRAGARDAMLVGVIPPQCWPGEYSGW